jgi:hypothetical protein
MDEEVVAFPKVAIGVGLKFELCVSAMGGRDVNSDDDRA